MSERVVSRQRPLKIFWPALSLALLGLALAIGGYVWYSWPVDSITSGFAATPVTYMVDVGADVYFCMSVKASPAEVDRFLARHFTVDQRVAAPVDNLGVSCAVKVGLAGFAAKTLAYRGSLDVSEGAVFERDSLFYWDIED